jgi:excinuclease ABC subunit A
LLDKPDVDQIEGLSPTIAIDQHSSSHNPRSTVGTITEIYDYLRLLFAKVGVPHCPQCSRALERQSLEQILARVLALPAGSEGQVLAPLARQQKGDQSAENKKIKQSRLLAISFG